MQSNTLNKRAARVQHIESHLQVDHSGAVENLKNNTGSALGSALNLTSHAEARAMHAWFAREDIAATKQWAYVSARLSRLSYEHESQEYGLAFKHSPIAKMLSLLMPLLSENEDLINWFAKFDTAYDQKRIENHKTADFRAYQAIVALRGDWPRLLARSEKALTDPPRANAEQKFLIDQQFFLALAQGNIAGMESALTKILTPRALAARHNHESGYTADLISSYAFIYAKIAWFRGYKIIVDSPFLPGAWLPIAPLKCYDPYYSFLKDRESSGITGKIRCWSSQLRSKA
jgi:hypothetical protein